MKHVIKFLKRYNELWLGPLGLILFLVSMPLIRNIDPRAVAYTMDAFQKIIFGHVCIASALFSLWLVLRLTWPDVFRYLVDGFQKDFSNLIPFHKCVICFAAFFSYLFALVEAMRIL